MLNKLIAQKANEWLAQPDCPVQSVVSYIEGQGKLREAQIQAIKIYLFLKIVGRNRPLWELLRDGVLTQTVDLSKEHISQEVREVFEANPAARALYEFSQFRDSDGIRLLFPDLGKYLLENINKVDCEKVLKSIFYNVDYPDYLFSLPMGAGKTYLMAEFIYLDLYFADIEPDNPIWAHNFIVLAPSGLKSSIIPSLKTIEGFDPTWVLPEPAASNIKRIIKFEILDQAKAASKNNQVVNPNSAKIQNYQPFDSLMGLVVVTNAEKVILDRTELSDQGTLIELNEDEQDKRANELRHLIGKIPNLQIIIDEVHHVAKSDIKLRQVVTNWHTQGKDEHSKSKVNGVLGFSGTPYLASPEPVVVAEGLTLKFTQITNTVYYYPLTRAIEAFLKKPTVSTIDQLTSVAIVRRGVQEFLNEYGTLIYDNGTTAKLAIYCSNIERLENEVYPFLTGAMGISPDDILKYHGGNNTYKISTEAKLEWENLNTHLSSKRIVLLVQIGKEGWDCPSLTGVILSQKGDCPTNKVLQTSCRCLRQIEGGPGTAGIWLNADNAKILNKQLQVEQHTSIEEINKLKDDSGVAMRKRSSRMKYLQLPPVDFYQMRVRYEESTVEEANPNKTIPAINAEAFYTVGQEVKSTLDINQGVTSQFIEEDLGETANFNSWLLTIIKGSFGALSMSELRPYQNALHAIFDAITFEQDGILLFNSLYDEADIASRIRVAFHDIRSVKYRQDIFDEKAHILLIEKVGKDGKEMTAIATDKKYLYPSEADAKRILTIDDSGLSIEEYALKQREGYDELLKIAKEKSIDVNLLGSAPSTTLPESVRHKDQSFHVVPYNFDSSFELNFLRKALTSKLLKDRGLELYFNGEKALTSFQIDCFEKSVRGWNRIGKYTPDFLLIERKNDAIHRALIIETKGDAYVEKFRTRREYMATEFLRINNDKFGYERFDFLYFEDKMKPAHLFELEKRVEHFFEN